jgi:hypothetical protein
MNGSVMESGRVPRARSAKRGDQIRRTMGVRSISGETLSHAGGPDTNDAPANGCVSTAKKDAAATEAVGATSIGDDGSESQQHWQAARTSAASTDSPRPDIPQ